MNSDIETIKKTIRDYLVSELLAQEDNETIEYSTPLITGGLLDSISSVGLISFLEKEYGVPFEAHEISVEYLDSVEIIATTVMSKLNRK